MRLRLVFVFLLLTGLAGTVLVESGAASDRAESVPGQRVEIRESGLSRSSLVAAPPPSARRAQTATFVVNYDAGFQANPAARAAFQRAVDIWSTQLESTVPIVVEASFEPLSAGVLGSAGAWSIWRNFSGAPRNDTWYSSALANQLAGRDLAPTSADIVASFSSSANWYYGTDGNTPGNTSDFVSVVLHELGHGIGFSDSTRMSGLVGEFGHTGNNGQVSPVAYDRFLVTGAGTSIVALTNGSLGLGAALTSGSVYFNGAMAMAANGGTRPRIYAPTTWQSGSSIAHLDEATFPAGHASSLMTPLINRGEAIHDPGPIGRGVLADVGWTISGLNVPTSTPTLTPTSTSTPAITFTPTPTRTSTPTPTIPTAGSSLRYRLFVPVAPRPLFF